MDPAPQLVIALIVIGIYVVMQQVESIVLVPKVQGRAVSLPPLVVLISVVAMFGAFGVLGGLLAVPAVATGREVARFLWARLWDLEPFPEEVAAIEAEMVAAAEPPLGATSDSLSADHRRHPRRVIASSTSEAAASAHPQESV